MVALITGCGRSGSLYMVTCLRRAGLDVGHESLGKDGAVSSVWCAPEPPYPSYHQQGPRPTFDVSLHQVREPLATIGSATTGARESWAFVARWIDIDLDWHPVKIASHYWYQWNHMAEEQSELTYRIENLRERWPEIMALIGHDCPVTAINGVPKDVNSRPHPEVTWNDVGEYAPRIRAMARRYGYL